MQGLVGQSDNLSSSEEDGELLEGFAPRSDAAWLLGCRWTLGDKSETKETS